MLGFSLMAFSFSKGTILMFFWPTNWLKGPLVSRYDFILGIAKTGTSCAFRASLQKHKTRIMPYMGMG